MSALAFDPWAALKTRAQDATPPKAPNPPNRDWGAGCGLGALGGLGGVASSTLKNAAPASRPRLAALATLAGEPSPTLKTASASDAALRTACEARGPALAGAYDDPDVQADRAAIAADVWPGARPAGGEPSADLVERLAQAMAAPRPWQRVTDPDKARSYFAAQARRRLAPLDGLARGLLVQAEEAEARRWAALGILEPEAAGTGEGRGQAHGSVTP